MLFATTDRFNLRTVERTDKAAIIEVCGDRRVSLSMSNMPHPFTETHADAYLNLVIGSYNENMPITFAIADKSANRYLGLVGLAPARCREKGNLVSIPDKAELFFPFCHTSSAGYCSQSFKNYHGNGFLAADARTKPSTTTGHERSEMDREWVVLCLLAKKDFDRICRDKSS